MKREGEKERRAFIGGFDHAWRGVVLAVRTQRNMRFHAVAAVAVLVASFFFRVSLVEFAILVFAISLVLAAELVNTAVEAIVNLVSPEHHPLAKIAKDAAAGAVLVSSIGAAVVGVVIFFGKVIAFLSGILESFS
ncbi:MAG: diacylglycerol kinase family protein [Rubrobacteraceae bacterium]